MPKSDPAHRETDKLLTKMEAEIKSVYTQAYKEAQQTADSFMKQFTEADVKKREALENGDISKEEYARWQRTQLFQGKRYQQMADTLSKDLTNSNKIAASVINGHLPEVYALNHNYGTYEMESGGRVNTQYTLYDRQTVERLLRDDPDLLPHARVDIPKDLIWNKKSINSAITQGILQGEDIDTISQRLAHTVTDMSRTSAIRNARTMTTSAENGGRIDSYKRAESMGIKMVQVWVATLDSRTRHEHRQLDGQKRKIGEPFTVDGYEIDFPADPKAEAFLVYNCRCTLIGQVQGVNFDLSDTTSRDNKLGGKTYEEWKEEKRKQNEGEPPAPKNEPKPKTEDKPAEVEVPAPTVEKPDAVDEPIKPQFTPARTKEEATKYAEKFAEQVDFGKTSLDDMNAINEALTELTDKYPITKLEEIGTKTGKAAMSANFRGLHVNGTVISRDVMKTAEKFKEIQESTKASISSIKEHWQGKKMPLKIKNSVERMEDSLKYKRWTVHQGIEDRKEAVKSVVSHEYGHIIADQYFGQISGVKANANWSSPEAVDFRRRWSEAFTKAKESGDIYNLSQYASTNSYEFFAESFAAREMGEKLPDYVESLMKEVLDNGIM